MSLARRYWTNWRGEMSQTLKKVSSLEEALKPEKVPKGLLWEDWEWLVLEHYTDPDFQVICDCYQNMIQACFLRHYFLILLYSLNYVNCRSKVSKILKTELI